MESQRTIHVAHSPDSDDAFMFYALAEGLIETGGRINAAPPATRPASRAASSASL